MVAWTTVPSSGQDGSSFAIKAQAFDASGAKIGGEILVNTLATGAQFLPDVATLADGRVIVTWTSENGDGSGYAVRAQILQPNRAAEDRLGRGRHLLFRGEPSTRARPR